MVKHLNSLVQMKRGQCLHPLSPQIRLTSKGDTTEVFSAHALGPVAMGGFSEQHCGAICQVTSAHTRTSIPKRHLEWRFTMCTRLF